MSKKRKKKNIDRTKYGDYTDSSLNSDDVGIHKFIYGLISLFIFIYCLIGLINGEFTFSSRRSNHVMHLTGIPMVIFILAFLLLTIGFFIPVLEYKNRKHNFHNRNQISKRFRKIKKWIKYLTWTCFILSFVAYFLKL